MTAIRDVYIASKSIIGYPGAGNEEVRKSIAVEKIGTPETGSAEAVGLYSSTLDTPVMYSRQ